MKHPVVVTLLLLAAVFLLFVLNLFIGSVDIPVADVGRVLTGKPSQPSWEFIILHGRLPQAVTAVFAGMSLSVSGLLLQTAFRNPLAGPSIFGVSSGAALGAAVVMLLLPHLSFGGLVVFGGGCLVVVGAFLGALLVTAVVFAFSLRMTQPVSLLIVGIMVGSLASSVIMLLNFFATEQGVHSYLVWGMGNFSGISSAQLPLFVWGTLVLLAGALFLSKWLNLLLLGDAYAASLGISPRRVRVWLLLLTSLLTALTTAFCGPIAFIGLAVPHLARLAYRTSDHRLLLPATLLTGAVVCLACNLLSTGMPSSGIIPLNAITPLIGAPIVIYLLTRQA